MLVARSGLECGTKVPFLRLEIARDGAVALTLHRGVSTMGKQENADPAMAGSALQGVCGTPRPSRIANLFGMFRRKRLGMELAQLRAGALVGSHLGANPGFGA